MACRRGNLWVAAGVVLLVLAAAGWVPLVRFVSEEITLVVRAGEVELDGLYVYRNPWPVPVIQGMSVPLPVDESHPPPVLLQVETIQPARQELPLRYLWKRHRFDLRLPARGEVRVRVSYRQQAPASSARYILTTTQPWWQGIEHGKYRLRLDGVEIMQSNYGLATVATNEVGFDRQDFMPSADWRFAWRTSP